MISARTVSVVLTLLMASAVLVIALAPSAAESTAYGSDKVRHALAFAALVLPIALLASPLLRWSVPGLVLFGALIEVLQPWFGRDRSLYDLCADVIGIILGLLVWRAIKAVSAQIT